MPSTCQLTQQGITACDSVNVTADLQTLFAALHRLVVLLCCKFVVCTLAQACFKRPHDSTAGSCLANPNPKLLNARQADMHVLPC